MATWFLIPLSNACLKPLPICSCDKPTPSIGNWLIAFCNSAQPENWIAMTKIKILFIIFYTFIFLSMIVDQKDTSYLKVSVFLSYP